MTLLVRARGEPADIVPAIRDEVLALDPNLPLQLGVPVRRLYAESIARQRFVLALIGGFAGIALLLGAVGLYGVAAYAVAQRRREIGLRVALCARPSEATRLVLRHGLVLALCGVALGTAAALALTRLLGDLLYDVGPRDPWTFGVVALLLTLVAAVACWIPARRAARVDPMVALRAE